MYDLFKTHIRVIMHLNGIKSNQSDIVIGDMKLVKNNVNGNVIKFKYFLIQISIHFDFYWN